MGRGRRMPSSERVGFGVLLVCACYFTYSLHYATVKWLNVSYPLAAHFHPQRADARLHRGDAAARRGGGGAEPVQGRHRGARLAAGGIELLLLRGRVPHGAGRGGDSLRYGAADDRELSPVLLGERVGGLRWLAVLVGLAGTVIAAAPTGDVNAEAVLYGLGSGVFWALTVVYTRKSGARESTAVQLFTTALVFCAVSAALADWQAPRSAFDGSLMLALGVQIFIAQMLFFEAYRHASASLLGLLEYTSVVWSGVFGFLIFRDLPSAATVAGAALIIGSGVAPP